MAIEILLADDHRVIREGLRALLEQQEDFRVVGEASNGHDAVRLALGLKPQVIIMDVAMPDLSGIEACSQVRAEAPEIKVVALSMHSDTRFVQSMLAAGASQYLLKDCPFEELATAIRTAVADSTLETAV